MSPPIGPAIVSGCDKVLGSKMIEPSSRTHVSCGAPRLVTIGGKSTIVEDCAGALAVDSAGLSAVVDPTGRHVSKAAPAQAARQTTIANSINHPLGDPFPGAPSGRADSDI